MNSGVATASPSRARPRFELLSSAGNQPAWQMLAKTSTSGVSPVVHLVHLLSLSPSLSLSLSRVGEERREMLSASISYSQREQLGRPPVLSCSRVMANTSRRVSNCAPGIRIMFLNFGLSRSKMPLLCESLEGDHSNTRIRMNGKYQERQRDELYVCARMAYLGYPLLSSPLLATPFPRDFLTRDQRSYEFRKNFIHVSVTRSRQKRQIRIVVKA